MFLCNLILLPKILDIKKLYLHNIQKWFSSAEGKIKEFWSNILKERNIPNSYIEYKAKTRISPNVVKLTEDNNLVELTEDNNLVELTEDNNLVELTEDDIVKLD